MLLQPMSAKRFRKGGSRPMSVWLWNPQCSHNPLRNMTPKKETDLSKTMGWKEEGATAGWGWRAIGENSPGISVSLWRAVETAG